MVIFKHFYYQKIATLTAETEYIKLHVFTI